MSRHTVWQSPLVSRYTNLSMQMLFGERRKFTTWRRLWRAMADCQRLLGAPITWEQVEELGEHTEITDLEIARAAELERSVKHDVVAHTRVFGEVCPTAAPIIHLGCTSMFVVDNTDLIIMREGLDLLIVKVATCLHRMAAQAEKWADLPTLGWTHFQAAQPTTVGKRIAMWMQDLLMDLEQIIAVRNGLKFLGAKGATGTQDSYLKLFQGDASAVQRLDEMLAQEFGFSGHLVTICGQTYTRKVDTLVLSALAGISSSVHKMFLDLRLLQNKKEIEEPFDKDQAGSSAMPYKRNPMRAERSNGLARHGFVLPLEAYMTHALQFLERSLDDSAPRRTYIPEAFLTADAVLNIVQNVFEDLVVYPMMIERNLRAELPFMVTEEILVAMVNAGKDRTECYEKLRGLSKEAGRQIKQEGRDNPFLDLVRADPYFADVIGVITETLDPKNYIGLAPAQTRAFLENEIEPVLAKYQNALAGQSTLAV